MTKLKEKKAVLYALVLLAVFISPAAAQTITIDSPSAAPGATVTQPLVAINITDVAAYSLTLSYNPSVVVVDDVTAGAFGTLITNINNASGTTSISAFSVTGFSGNVVLANVVLRAVGTAGQTSGLVITVTEIVDSNGVAIPVTVAPGTFSITAAANGTLRGQVTDSFTGSGINGATVTAANVTTGLVVTDTTNAAGLYSMSLPARTYIVVASATGYFTSTPSPQTVTAGLNTTFNIPLVPTVPPFAPVTLTLAPGETGSALANGADSIALAVGGNSASTYQITSSNPDVRFYPANLLGGSITSISGSSLFRVVSPRAIPALSVTVTNATNATDTATVANLGFITGDTGQITGFVKDVNGNGIGDVEVILTSILPSVPPAPGIEMDRKTTLASGPSIGSYSFTGVSEGSYIVNATNITIAGILYAGEAQGPITVTAGQTTGGIDVIMLAVPVPKTKTDTVTDYSIPADGLTTTTITALIKDQDGLPMSNVTVDFALRDGTLIASGNGTLSITSGVTNGNGEVSTVLTSGLNPGTVVVYNEVNGTPTVNYSVTITFTPLQGHVTGTVRSSENVPIAGAQVVVSRLNLTSNVWEPVMAAGQQKSTVTGSNGDYTLSFIPVLVDVHHNVLDTITGESGNTLLLEASKTGYNNGTLITWISSADRTAEGNDIVMTTGQPDQIYVSVDNSVHQVLDSPAKLADGVSTWSVTAQLMKSGANAGIAGQSITFAIDNLSIATLSSATAVTDATGKATVTLTSTLNPGIVKATGSFLTRDNMLLTDYDYAQSKGVAQLSGIVTNENQTQLPGATVTLWLDLYGNGTVFVPAVDINGNVIPSQTTPPVGPTAYTFTAVPSGTYKVTATLGGQSGFAYPVIVTSGTTTANVVIVGAVAPTTGSITGIVTNAPSGAAIAGATVTAGSSTATTDTNGAYSISIAPGTYTVTVSASGYTSTSASVTVTSGATTTQNFALLSVSTGIDPADTNGDRQIDINELMTAIGWWKAGTYDINSLMTSISRWKAGGY